MKAETQLPKALYFVRDETLAEFRDEAKQYRVTLSELSPGIFASVNPERLFWVLDYWPVNRLAFTSVSDAAKQLRRMGRFWAYAGGNHYRRGMLIADNLRCEKERLWNFPVSARGNRWQAFTLSSPNDLLCSAQPLKHRFAGGRLRFVEDREGPPSRAYLKLYEALTLADVSLGSDDQVLDLGATPGGWSYVAACAGAQVQMVDRAAPDSGLLRKFPQIRFHKGDGLNPPVALLEDATVILSDMACEPAKLFESVERWRKLPRLKVMVCTLKFHGKSDKHLIRQFAAIAGSEIYHLWHNGHELTWVWRR
ncbi:MAG: SAM-dependent methyltransferase [Leptospiraceae bacterium]|nr:SAM-dependent methyltransferase [Leptospiraceae bacterium]